MENGEYLRDRRSVAVAIKIVQSFFGLVLVPTRTLIDNSFFSFAKHRSSFAAARAKLAQNLDRDIGLGCAPFHIFWPHYHNIAGSGGQFGDCDSVHCVLQVSYCAAFTLFSPRKTKRIVLGRTVCLGMDVQITVDIGHRFPTYR